MAWHYKEVNLFTKTSKEEAKIKFLNYYQHTSNKYKFILLI